MNVIDTDDLIDVLRDHSPANQWFESQFVTPVVFGFLVLLLIDGCRNAREVQRIQGLIHSLEMIWPDNDDCERALATFSKLHLSVGMGVLDAMIAATVIGKQANLYTFNAKHFRHFPGLNFAAPYVR